MLDLCLINSEVFHHNIISTSKLHIILTINRLNEKRIENPLVHYFEGIILHVPRDKQRLSKGCQEDITKEN